ncbi:MAG: TonB-dependent receptor [Bacteroidales bacterium]|nr:TonB-dependent receptor [Bacteroidales bacterium]
MAGILYAQTKTVTGVVVDELDSPIPGVNVVVSGTTNGTITDFDGKYSINVPDGAQLTFSFIGYNVVTIPVTGTKHDVKLEPEFTALDEVVAVGYGTQKRKDITGSVASVSSDVLAAVPVSSASEALTGKMAGVQITTTEGSPDADVTIRVRGGGSITGDNSPLYIVDGFPVESISDIAASDIESIDVLKDASSTAIYGSRGANGVILVTTKGGKEGKTSVSYNAYYSWKKVAKTLDVLDSYDYARWNYEHAMLEENKPDEINPEAYTKYFGNFQDMDQYKDIETNDWQDLTFGRIGHTFNHNLSITGGVDKFKYNFGYATINDKAIMEMSNFRRDNISLKLSAKPHKRVGVDFSVRFAKTKVNGAGANESKTEASSADSRLKHAVLFTPFPVDGLTNVSADDSDPSSSLYNPVENLADNDQSRLRKDLNLAGSVNYEFIDGFTLKAEVGYNDYKQNTNRFFGRTTYFVRNNAPAAYQGSPAVIFTNVAKEKLRSTNTLNMNFKNIIPEDHSLTLLVGHEYIISKSETQTNKVYGLPKTFNAQQGFKLSALGANAAVDNYLSPDDKLLSFFGRANYDFQGKYLVSATFRADGSSKFSEGNKWGMFPSAALAWRISSESFMDATQGWLDDLKLRLSFGTAGNNNIPAGQMVQSYAASDSQWINGYSSFWNPSKTMANPDLTWETTITRNAGIDFTTFGGKFSGTLEAYYNSTKDLLINFPVPGTGYDTQYRNMGETQNKGFEVTLNYVVLDHADYGLTISANAGINRNEIVDLGLMDDFGAESSWASSEIGYDYWISKGGRVGQMYGYQYDGRYEVSDFSHYDAAAKKWVLKEGVADNSTIIGKNQLRPGAIKFKNTDGSEDNQVTTDDRSIIGDANPDLTGGFSINARAYGFDLAANFNFVIGNDVYNANKMEYTSTSKNKNRNMISDMAMGKRWNNLNEDGTICNDPVALAAMNEGTTMHSPWMSKHAFSDWAVEDGSFLRLSTLTLGYTLPKSWTSKWACQSFRVYCTAYNVFCLTNYSGFDPEVSTRTKTALTPNVDYSAYPKSRQLVVGLNLNF